MSRFVKLATGLRDFGNDINANISKALNISKVADNPNEALLDDASAGRLNDIESIFIDYPGVVDVNGALDHDFMSPLCLACAGGHEDVALYLLKCVNADSNNAVGAAAAASAARGRSEANTGGDFADDSSGRAAPFPPSPLILAVEAGLVRIVRELIVRGARVDATRAVDGWNALHVCASKGNAVIMSELVGAPLADPGSRTARLETAFSIACSRGHLSVVDLLLCVEEKKADDELEDDDDDEGGSENDDDEQKDNHYDVVQDDESSAQEVKKVGGENYAGAASLVSTTAAVSRLSLGGQAEERTWSGRTPLHRAALHGHTEIVLRLLVHGVRADPVDKDGVTPLMLAARGGHFAAVHELIQRGKASVTAAADEGDTALHVAAAASGKILHAKRVVRLLLKAGANVDAQNVHGSTALHLAAAVGAYDSVLHLLSAGANPTMVNSCGLSPGSFFLGPPHASGKNGDSREQVRRTLQKQREKKGHIQRLSNSSAKRAAIAAVACDASVFVHGCVEFALKTQRWDLDAREHLTRLRRLDKFQAEILSDPPSGAPSEGIPDAVLQRSGTLRPVDPQTETRALSSPPPLLLDLSPEREGRAAWAVKQRRTAAVEAAKGARLALQDLEDWKAVVLVERAAVTSFLRRADPLRAFTVGRGRDGNHDWEDDDFEGDKEGEAITGFDAFGGNWSFLSAAAAPEGVGGVRGENGWRGSWTTGTLGSSPTDRGDGDGENPSGGRGGSGRSGPVGFVRALAALDPCMAALRRASSAAAKSEDRLSLAFDALREHVKSTLIDLMDLETSIPGEGSFDGDGNDDEDDDDQGMGGGKEARATLLTSAEAAALDVKVCGLLQRLSGSADGDPDDSDDSGEGYKGGENRIGNKDRDWALHAGKRGSGSIRRTSRRGGRNTRSLATVYARALGGAASAMEGEVDTAEQLTAKAMRMVIGAVAGPLLRALDDAYQRLTRAYLELRQMLPDAEALLEGPSSDEERMRKSRSRLVTIRQQVIDEEDLLEELLSKLRRRRRQAASDEEIGAIEEERLQVRARLATLRSVKLAELKALRQSDAYHRFPELLLEHPNRAEVAFRSLLVNGIAVRDLDEWGEHHMASLQGMRSGSGSMSGGTSGAGGGCVALTAGGSDRILNGIGGDRCRLAEIDGSAVAVVEVDCRNREAERSLVASLLKSAPSARRGSSGSAIGATRCYFSATSPELAAVTGISLDGERALLEVPVEGALSAKAWLTTAEPASAAAAGTHGMAAASVAGEPRSAFSVGVQELAQVLNMKKTEVPGVIRSLEPPKPPEPEPEQMELDQLGLEPESSAFSVKAERSHAEVWAVMVQALRGLAAVHAVSEESTHRAVCLSNILVAARSARKSATVTAQENATVGVPYSYPLTPQMVEVEPERNVSTTVAVAGNVWSASPLLLADPMRHGFRRAQLAPPSPASLAQPPTEYVAPEVVRGQPFRQPADVYAFGIALRAAFCGGHEEATYYIDAPREGSKGGGGTGMRSLLPRGRGPAEGPFREALVEVLEKMLEEDASRRCTALEALASDFLRVPPNESPKLYPPTWSTFPVIHRSHSATAVGAQPHWVAVTLAQGRKDVGSQGKGWWESCFAVDVPTSPSGLTSGDSGQFPKGERGEVVEIEAMLRHSLPGARLLRLVRLQDRGRWLRFVCERNSAISSIAAASASSTGLTDGTGINSPPVGRFFADPRDVVSLEALSAIAAPVDPTSVIAKIGGRTVPSTRSEDDKGEDEAEGVAGGTERFSRRGFVATGSVRCTKVARFAAVAFALPPGERQGQSEKVEETFENIRTVAVIRAVTGVSQERRGLASVGAGAGTVVPATAPVVSAAGGSSNLIMSSASSAGKRAEDPFLGVDPSIDDLTRVGGISILPSAAYGVDSVLTNGGGEAGAAAGNRTLAEQPVAAASLSSHTVHSVKIFESLTSASAQGLAGGECRGEGATTTVFEVRSEACYPEYLATFSFPPHAV